METKMDIVREDSSGVRRVSLVGAPYARIGPRWWFIAMGVLVLTSLYDWFFETRVLLIGCAACAGYLLMLFVSRELARRELGLADNREGDPDLIFRGNKDDFEQLRNLPDGLMLPHTSRQPGTYRTPGRAALALIAVSCSIRPTNHFLFS